MVLVAPYLLSMKPRCFRDTNEIMRGFLWTIIIFTKRFGRFCKTTLLDRNIRYSKKKKKNNPNSTIQIRPNMIFFNFSVIRSLKLKNNFFYDVSTIPKEHLAGKAKKIFIIFLFLNIFVIMCKNFETISNKVFPEKNIKNECNNCIPNLKDP